MTGGEKITGPTRGSEDASNEGINKAQIFFKIYILKIMWFAIKSQKIMPREI
jgi:hypothetical protein